MSDTRTIKELLIFGVTAILVILILSGCGLVPENTKTVTVQAPDGTTTTTSYDYSNDAVYYDSAARHSEAEAKRVDTQVKAVIASASCPGCTPGEKALSTALAATIIEHIAPQTWTIQRGTSGMDVAHDLATGVALPLGIVTVGAVRMNKDSSRAPTISGETNNFDHSFNPTDQTTTGTYDSPSIQPGEPTIVRPEVVQPEVVKTTAAP